MRRLTGDIPDEVVSSDRKRQPLKRRRFWGNGVLLGALTDKVRAGRPPKENVPRRRSYRNPW